MKQIAITIGDLNGIGPEVALKAVFQARWPADVQFVLLGPPGAICGQAERLGLPDPTRSPISRIEATGTEPVWVPGTIQEDASVVAAEAIERAVAGCLSGAYDAMVTAPICKEGFHQAGIGVPGHTEYLAKLTATANFGMMLLGGGLRVMLATRHLPLKAVPDALNRALIREQIELAGEALKLFGIRNGRIGVCGLNPHAGDGGVLGREEIDLINPAVGDARAHGYTVSDAVPADTIFYEALQGRYDAVVAMYHDQGLGPLKMIGFDEGVNITLGLPIIRTSPDHGTAFGIAGKNQANAKSMCNALALAVDLAGKKNPWKR